jgi:hypothetical protein
VVATVVVVVASTVVVATVVVVLGAAGDWIVSVPQAEIGPQTAADECQRNQRESER